MAELQGKAMIGFGSVKKIPTTNYQWLTIVSKVETGVFLTKKKDVIHTLQVDNTLWIGRIKKVENFMEVDDIATKFLHTKIDCFPSFHPKKSSIFQCRYETLR